MAIAPVLQESDVPISTEVQDQVHRSNRKLKEDEGLAPMEGIASNDTEGKMENKGECQETQSKDEELEIVTVEEIDESMPDLEEVLPKDNQKDSKSQDSYQKGRELSYKEKLLGINGREKTPPDTDSTQGNTATRTNPAHSIYGTKVEVGEEAFGPWMIPQKRSRRRPRQTSANPNQDPKPQPGTEQQVGNRFISISVEEQPTADEGDHQTSQNTLIQPVQETPIVEGKQIPIQPEIKSKAVRSKSKKPEVQNQPVKRQNPSNSQAVPNKKASKMHLEKTQEHTVVMSMSQANRVTQNMASSPAKTTQRIRVFLWSLAHEGIMTENQRWKRKMTDNDVCKRCLLHSETSLHALRDCCHVAPLWRSLIPQNKWRKFFSLNLCSWIEASLSSSMGCSDNFSWNTKFGYTCWLIWKQRNNWVFNGKKEEAISLLPILKIQLEDFNNATKVMKEISNDSNRENTQGWVAPEVDWIKVNTDGSYYSEQNSMACGGVARDKDNNWIFGFSKRLGRGNALHAEIWGILQGLKIAWEKGYKKVIIESDSSLAIQLALGTNDQPHYIGQIIKDIHTLVNKDWTVKFSIVKRDFNTVADKLASWAQRDMFGLRLYNNPPLYCRNALYSDSSVSEKPNGAAS
ncbi:hypothetical protein G2W53_042152 [Senna tora]|uniref:RNase H type-1 domain-containing protein n=1 Tax=Senna tora TaxID=362788 RepID=A0A834SGD0_9FABA|nr:hypothetical protein G2W53_042152 [Senna tora]